MCNNFLGVTSRAQQNVSQKARSGFHNSLQDHKMSLELIQIAQSLTQIIILN